MLLIAVVVIVIAAGAWLFFFNKPSYPDITSPRPVRGNPDASVVLVEFSDFECPACENAFPYVKAAEKDFANQVRFEYKHYPLNASCNDGLGGTSHYKACDAAYASECANDQNRFWEYHDTLFEKREWITGNTSAILKSYAQTLGLDTASFNACLDSQAKRDVVLADTRQGNAQGVNSTPSFFVNGQYIANYTNLRAQILAKLAEGGK